MPGDLTVTERGSGPPILLVHGSAADSSTWTIQMATLARTHRLIAYDRRGGVTSVAEHAADAQRVLDDVGIEAAHVCGSSFGAVVALELARTAKHRVAGLILCEPPMACGDTVPPVPNGFGCMFDRVVAERGGPAAGELFLRLVLSEPVLQNMPAAFRERACAKWQQIREDSLALAAYRPRYDELCSLDLPVLLVCGERSSPYYADTLDTLALHLPDARLSIIAGAGHMMHAESPRLFNAAVAELVRGWPAL